MITFCKKWRNKDHLTESVLAEQEHKRKTLDKEYNFKRIVRSLKKKKNSFNARKIALDHNDSVDKRKQQLGDQQNNASNRLKMRKSKRWHNKSTAVNTKVSFVDLAISLPLIFYTRVIRSDSTNKNSSKTNLLPL